jgi:surface carbohydrate biosynthesis protein/FkbM family methyltransferase
LLLLREALRRRGHETWIEPLWTHPETTVRAYDPDTVIMGQIGEETTSQIAHFIRQHHINLVINTTEYVCNSHKKDNFFKFNFKEWNENHIDMQVIVNHDYDQHIKNHKEINSKTKYKFIGCPRFDLSVHPEICIREKQAIAQKYQLDRFNRKYLYISSFIFDESGGQVSKENLKDIDTAFLFKQEQDQKKLHDAILRALIQEARSTNDALLIKRHPWDKSSFYLDTYRDPNVVLVDNHDYIVPLLQLSDVVLHTESTVAIEGWIQGRKTISVLPRFDGDRSKLKNNMYFEPIARNYSEIKALIENYPFSETRRSLENYQPFLDGKATLRLAELIEGLPSRPLNKLFHTSNEEKKTFRQLKIAERLKTAEALRHSNKDHYEYLHRYLDQFRRIINEMYLEPINRFLCEQMPPTLQYLDEKRLESSQEASVKEMVADCSALLGTERHSQAMAFLKRIAESHPQCSSACFALAKAISATGDASAATEMYRRAAGLAPENIKYQFQLATHLFETNDDLQGAIAICKGIYQSRPDHVDNLWLLTRISSKLHGPAGCLNFAKAILEIEPNHPEAMLLTQQPELSPVSSGDASWRTVLADGNLGNVLRQAQARRFGKWCVHFGSLRIYCQDLMAFYIAAKDIFLHEIYGFTADSPAPRVIDGGGHLGLFTLYVKSKYPTARVTVFEPDTLSLSLLRKNLSANGIQDAEVIEAGLLDREDALSFGSDGSDGSSIFSGKPNCEIKTLRLGNYLHETIDFLKLNIEGAEYAVIKDIGADLGRVRQMVIEYHGFPETGQQLHHILSILDRAGFRYLIHDFDTQTNPSTKPPFDLSSESRFFLLIYAKQMTLAGRSTIGQAAAQPKPDQKALSVQDFYANEFMIHHLREIHGRVAIVGHQVPQAIVDAADRNKATVQHFPIDPRCGIEGVKAGADQNNLDCVILWGLPNSNERSIERLQWSAGRLGADGTLLVMNPGVCSLLGGDSLKPTDRALEKLIIQALPGTKIELTSYGNAAAAKWMVADDQLPQLAPELLRIADPDYQVAVGAKLHKCGAGDNMPKGRPRKRLLLYTLWRSGTHWIANLMSEIIGIPWTYTDGQNAFSEIKTCLEKNTIAVRHLSHTPDEVLQWSQRLDFDILFVWRDIRDVIASNVNMRKYVEGHRPGLPPFPDMEANDILKWELAHYATTYTQLLPAWIQKTNPWMHQVRYESMVYHPHDTMRTILKFIQLDLESSRLEEILRKYSFKKLAGRESGVEQKNSHYRKGVVGDWESQFDSEGRALVADLFAGSWFASSAWDRKSLHPRSRKFGFDRGKPIDRIFIEHFLKQKSGLIRGRVLEIADNAYTRAFGSGVECSDVLNVQAAPGATLVGDLTTGENIPTGLFDCIILTQTLNVVYDARATLQNAYKALKPGGAMLLSAPGISQVSRYDMDRWGDYWRFGSRELQQLVAEALPDCQCRVESYGNRQVAGAFLDGLAAQELPAAALKIREPEYAILQTAEIHKPWNISVCALHGGNTAPRILLYHRVGGSVLDPQMLSVAPSNFEGHLKILAERYRVVSLYEMAEGLRKKELALQTVAITFDDGYGDNLAMAAPLLEKYKLPATMFVTAGILDSKHDFWWDAIERVLLHKNNLPAVLDLSSQGVPQAWSTVSPRLRVRTYHQLMSLLKQLPYEKIQNILHFLKQWAQMGSEEGNLPVHLDASGLKKLSESTFIEIGAHTISHTRLSALPTLEQKEEIERSKVILEETIGKPVRLFSYPFGAAGDFSEITMSLVKAAGFVAATANTQKSLGIEDSLFAMPRLLVRNCQADAFEAWMQSPDGVEMESQSLKERNQRLAKCFQ